MHTPLIFFAFANDSSAHLGLLKEESRRVFRALEELDRKEYLKIHREESASAKDIFEAFTRNKDRMAIFHYAGHANGTHLELEEGHGNAEGLSVLMGEQDSLKLVFLNGCSSRGQVKTLMDAGVKAVIATSVPIQDKMAMEFSEQFYEALAHRRTIGQAFQLAHAYIKTHHAPQEEKSFKDMMWGDFEAMLAGTKEEEELPWGLYVKKEHQDEILNWKLPYYRPVSLPDEVRDGVKRDFTANRYMIQVLFEMAKYQPDIYHRMVEQRGDQTSKVDSSTYPQLLISSFPWPIGSQIRILFVKEWREFGHTRLKQLLSTYVITSQVLYYILLSDFWQQVSEKKVSSPANDSMRLPSSKENYAQTDWLSMIAPLVERMEADNGQPFAPEYELIHAAWKEEGSSLRKAHAFLEKLRGKINELPTADLDKVCLKVEQAVSLVLRQAAFLSRYRMLTVRNISVDMPRTQGLTYELDMGHLSNSDGNFLSLYQDADKRRKQTYTNSRSIILVDNEDRLTYALDLSPFFMDRNTFVSTLQGGTSQDTTAKLYLIGWEADGKVHYLSIDQSIYLTLEEKLYQVHTDMTQADFDEGKNAEENQQDAADDWLDDDFGDEFEEDSLPTTTEESPKAFSLLKMQYDTFIADLSTPQSTQVHVE